MIRRRLRMFILITLIISVMTAENGISQTRLGLHVTQEELNFWRQRRTDNINRMGGITYQSMWNAVVTRANGFTSTSVDSWDPRPGTPSTWNGGSNFPDNVGGANNTHSPNFGRGEMMMSAAFVALVNQDATLGARVRQWLLNHAADPLLNLSNSTNWQLTNYDGVMIRVAPWFTRALFAYDYIRAAGYITGADRVTVETWLNKAGGWFLSKINTQISTNAFPNRPNNYASCTGSQCGGNQGALYFGGPTVNNLHTSWNNRISSAAMFVGAAGAMHDPVITWNVNFSTQIKWFVTEALRFQTWSNGANYDIIRWRDGGTVDQSIASSWTHGLYALGPLITIADHQARAGDSTLYNYTTSEGLQGTAGGTKSLLNASIWYANSTTGAQKFYGTDSAAQQNDTFWIRPFVEGNTHTEDWVIAIGNIFWQNSTVETGYSTARAVGTGCGGVACRGAPWGVYPHVLFMFGGMDGKVWPYRSSSGPAAPSSLRVVAETQ